MLQNGNKKYNNQMVRRQQQYQENENYEDIPSTPKQKIYQNAYNSMNNKTSNSIKNPNNRININSNTKMNRNNNNMNNNINNNNLNRGISNNINNNNLNRGMSNNRPNNNSDASNTNINKAILILKNEFKKKDDKIKLLELKVEELEKKINLITNSKSNISQQNNNNMNNNINVPFNKNFTFAELNSGEVNQFQNKIENNKINTGMEDLNADNNNNVYSQNKSSNQFQINNNQYNLNNNNNNLASGIKENSLTGNSGSSRNHSKNEVKLYLKEVKEKVEPFIFKEFIKNIKLLTSSKEMKGGVDRKKIVENVRQLFGEQYKELFIKFGAIIGI